MRATSTKDVIKNVFSNRNILAISLTTTLWSVCNAGWSPYWPLYLKHELGATVAVLGMLSVIQTSEQLLFQLPGGILADRFGRRKIILFGTSLRIIAPLIYLMATNWVHVIPAVIVNAMSSIYTPAFDAIIADSLPQRQRGAGYGAYRMITSLPRVFMPVLGGIIMDALGYKEGVRIFLIATIIASVVMILIRARFLTETLIESSGQRRSTRATLSA
ncbi:MAG: MFS transporter, partial [Candidatus Bathyarchaeia archaeon]